MSNISSSFIEKQTQLAFLDDSNIERLKEINLNGVSLYNHMKSKLSQDHFSEQEKQTIHKILTIPKKQRYIDLLNKHIPSPENLSDNQIQRIVTCVQEGYNLAKVMDKAFSHKKYPITKIVNRYDVKKKENVLIEDGTHQNYLVLSGGSIRDILFMKEAQIKDLDFCFAFTNEIWQYLTPTSHIHPDTINTLVSQGKLPDDYRKDPQFKELEQKTLAYTEKLMDKKAAQNIKNCFNFSYFVRHEMSKNGAISDAIYVGLHDEALMNEIGWEEYINDNLTATVKTIGKNGMPVDVLFSSYDIQTIISSFDFAICKSSLNFSDVLTQFSEYPTDIQKCIEYFYENVTIPLTVLRDIDEQTLTISKAYSYNPQKIDFFLKKHFPRLLKKYPGFKFNIEDSLSSDEVFSTRDVFLKHLLLENTLEGKKIPSESECNFKL